MGAYTSRPATLVVDFWRDEWRKRYVNFINVLSKYLEVIKDETLPPLLKACLTNELAKAKYLLTENDLSYKTPVSGLTPLHVCAITGSYECAQYFIQKFSGDVPLLTRNGVSALHLACFYDQEPIVQ
jgi:ankyrin repeat protein